VNGKVSARALMTPEADKRQLQCAIDLMNGVNGGWVARLDPDVLAAVGGDQFPGNPVHYIWGE
jgi:hypothetical protein